LRRRRPMPGKSRKAAKIADAPPSIRQTC